MTTVPEMITAAVYHAEKSRTEYQHSDGLTSIAFSLAAAVQILDTAFGATARLTLKRMAEEASEVENLYNQIEEQRLELAALTKTVYGAK